MDLNVFTYRQKVSSGLSPAAIFAHESYWLLTKSAKFKDVSLLFSNKMNRFRNIGRWALLNYQK